jgi:hypothetical protein
MKVFLEKIIKKTKTNELQKPFLTYILFSLVAVSLFILLTACGDHKAAPTAPVSSPPSKTLPVTSLDGQTPGQIATPEIKSEPAFAAAQPTTPTGQDSPDNLAGERPFTPAANLSNPEGYQPLIRFSPEAVQLGGEVEISGSGYPANTRLNVRVSTADLRTEQIYATVLTDESGNFKTIIKLEWSARGRLLTPGKIEIAAITQDYQVGASAPLALQPASNISADDACINLVQEFFTTLKRGSQAAQIYLTTDLRSRISNGATSLPGLLGLQNTPVRVDIIKVKGTPDSYQATMYFSSGEQKVAVLDVATDISGALKIAGIRAK